MLSRSLRSPYVTIIALGIVATVLLVVAYIAWAEPFEGRLWPMSPYALTPLLDMMAFTLVCVFSLVHALRERLGRHGARIARVTAGVALLAMVLHPGLLFWQLWRDGFGLPPLSYLHFYTEDQLIGVSIGTAGYILAGIALLYCLWRSRLSSPFAILLLLVGGAGMFCYSLLINVFVQESWFATIFIGYGMAFGLAMTASLVQLRRR